MNPMTLTAEDYPRLRAAGARAGDHVVSARASDEDARLLAASGQRDWVEKLLGCIDGVHAVVELPMNRLLVASDEHALPAALAILLEQGCVDVVCLAESFDPARG